MTGCLLSVLFILGECRLLYGQDAGGEPDRSEAQVSTNDDSIILTLKTIAESMEILESELNEKREELKFAQTRDQKLKIINDIDRLNERFDAMEKDYEEIATGVDLDLFAERPKERLDWTEEVRELLVPFIRELKTMTSRPRAIERLRGEVSYFEARIPVAQSAADNIHKLVLRTEDEQFKNRLEALQAEWEKKTQQMESRLTVARYQLEEKLGERKSFLESTQTILKSFFKNRGKNLLLAFLAFFFVFALLRYIHRFIYKISPFHKPEKRSYYVRLVDLAYNILTFVGAASALLIVVYISGDWVLLAFFIILIFGILWTARYGLPRFWEQSKLLLNLGAVRENERLVFKGIPWRIASLSFYTTLINPVLKGGVIRLPLRELVGLHSRPYERDEPWFPCKENDWVMLSDGTKGKVVSQTPEMVQLVLLGGSRKTYTVEEFLNQSPNNISVNFRINVTFGVDYQHQKISTTEIPDKLKDEVTAGLTAEGYGDDIINIGAEFKEAGPSSLDIAILADFEGGAAGRHEILSRAIQRIAVDCCNKYGWIIPFTQITLHQADSGR